MARGRNARSIYPRLLNLMKEDIVASRKKTRFTIVVNVVAVVIIFVTRKWCITTQIRTYHRNFLYWVPVNGLRLQISLRCFE